MPTSGIDAVRRQPVDRGARAEKRQTGENSALFLGLFWVLQVGHGTWLPRPSRGQRKRGARGLRECLGGVGAWTLRKEVDHAGQRDRCIDAAAVGSERESREGPDRKKLVSFGACSGCSIYGTGDGWPVPPGDRGRKEPEVYASASALRMCARGMEAFSC